MAGTLIVSLDFELFWGMLDVCPLEKYQDHVLGGRKAIPGLLALFQKYGIHATWATVGYLFARSAQEAASFFPEEGLRPAYDDPALREQLGRAASQTVSRFDAKAVQQRMKEIYLSV